MTSTLTGTASAGARSARSLNFDLHGRLGMQVEADAPTALQLQDMFGDFLTEAEVEPTISVSAPYEAVDAPSYAESDYEYTDDALFMTRPQVQVVRQGEGFRVHGTRELLTTVLPLVDVAAARRGAAMIHAATFEYKGLGLAMPAWGGTGKTSTTAKFLRHEDAGFMGDDWAFLAAEGELLGFLKPMFIKPHHRAIYPHLFAARKKPLIPPTIAQPVSRFTTLVHPVVTKYPGVAGFARRWSPEHMMVSPRQALPHARMTPRAPLAALVFVERHAGSQVELLERSDRWMVPRLLGNFHVEMHTHSREVLAAMGATGLVDLERVFRDKADVLRSACDGKTALQLRVPQSMSADEASDRIVEHLVRVLDAEVSR